MILVTRLDKQLMFLNPDHIISIEETPDTVITLYNGHHFIVKESSSVLINRIVSFRTRIVRRAGGARQTPKYIERVRFRRKSFSQGQAAAYGIYNGSGLRPLHTRDS